MSRPTPSRIGSATATEMEIRLVPNLAVLWDEIMLRCASSVGLAGKNLLKFIPVKKNGMTKRKIQYWVIPPEQDAEFVACMEEVLETYAQAYDPKRPVICMDEQPVQLVKETRKPIAATKKHAKRVDYEYERNGTASIFMFAEPLSGFRQATARRQRTKKDWAVEVAHLLDTRYAGHDEVILVLDNLNTHTKGAFYL